MLETRKEIEDWLSRCSEVCGFREYKINDNLVVDVNGTVNLANADLEEIPLQFGVVSGSFYCENNKLKSLKGAPHTVGEMFVCSNNQISTLNGGPELVGCSFLCANNRLSNLTGAPKLIGSNVSPYHDTGNFDCRYNPLIELGAPETQLFALGKFIFTGNCNYEPSHIPELTRFQHFSPFASEKICAGDFNSVVNNLKRIREEKALFESSIAKVLDTPPLGAPTKQAAEPQPQQRAKPKFKL